MKISRAYCRLKVCYTVLYVFYIEDLIFMNKSISAWFKAYWVHIICWSIFIGYEMLLVFVLQGTLSSFSNYFSHYVIIILWFYFAGNTILKWAFSNLVSSIWKFPVALALLFTVFTLLNFGVDYLLVYFDLLGRKTEVALNENYVYRISFRFINLLGIAMAYYFVKNFIKQKNISLELEKQKLQMMVEEERTKRALSKAHNDFLKAQINPHFLFNTLDFVYHNISEHSPEAADAVMTLSDMMRYAVDSSEQEEFIVLREEMEQVEKLIHLYQLRKNETLNIILDFDPEAADLRFVPLVLMTLVENIFKHGNIANADIGIQVFVGLESDKLIIETLNALNSNPRKDSSRAGLKNVRERLNFAYENQAECTFNSDGEVFHTRISIPRSALQTASGLHNEQAG
ncbi:sensor histidine kinase [Pedobacter aquatilis]|uniref:sensor histidine kinase n=1 Tax=Pedobacter aquatilis TaxID=351343 RepID=UPI00292F3E33|nr:histidine kinase [Pedobacter aquatilis]